MPHPPAEDPTRARIAVAVAATAVLLALGAVARHTMVSRVELDVFEWVNGWPDALAVPVWLVMQAGTLVGGALVGGVVLGMLRGVRGAAAGVAAAVGAWLVAATAKTWVSRGRPAEYVTVIDLHGDRNPTGSGYPSGHTAVAFAVATVVAVALPRRWRPLAYALATLVAIGRLYFGAHLPLDVVGGAAVGVAVGVLARFLVPEARRDRDGDTTGHKVP